MGKHDSIVSALRRDILRGKLPPGRQLPTNAELADRFGVSIVTVQTALNRLAREEFIHARARQGTFVADKLPHLNHYALVFWNDPTSPTWLRYYTALTNAAVSVERTDGKKIMLFHGVNEHHDCDDYQRLLSFVREHRLAGMIFANNPCMLSGTP